MTVGCQDLGNYKMFVVNMSIIPQWMRDQSFLSNLDPNLKKCPALHPVYPERHFEFDVPNTNPNSLPDNVQYWRYLGNPQRTKVIMEKKNNFILLVVAVGVLFVVLKKSR